MQEHHGDTYQLDFDVSLPCVHVLVGMKECVIWCGSSVDVFLDEF